MFPVLARALALASLSFAAVPAFAAPPPLEAYGRLPMIEDIEIAPTGDRVAYVAVDGEQRQLVVQSLDGKQRFRLNAGQAKVRGIDWAGPDHVLITTSTTAEVSRFRGRGEWFQVDAFNTGTRKFARLMGGGTPNTIDAVLGGLAVREYRGKPTVFVRGVTITGPYAPASFDLYRVNLDTGRGSIHEKGERGVGQWLPGPDGDPVARVEYSDLTGVSQVFARAGAGWRAVAPPGKDEDAIGLVGFGRAPGTLMLSKPDGEHSRLHEVSTTGGPLSPPLDPDDPAEDLLIDPTTRKPLALVDSDDRFAYKFFDPALDRAWRSASAPFKGAVVVLESWTPDFGKLILQVQGAEDAGTYYLVDVASKKATLLADAYPDVQPDAIGPVRSIRYKAADGLTIPAYLTLPPGRDAKNLPLIVLPHGGPQSRDAPGFDWWSQALASRGYAVLQPQFRGSEGFGRKFVEAGYGQWGRKMQTDLSDGVRHLAKEGLVDAKRVCIMGGSYGGYAAMAGITLDPGVYRCSVAVAGVGDLAAMLESDAKDAGRVNSGAVRYWSKFLGASFRKRAELDAISPTKQAAKAYAPVLVIHGKDDTVVYYQQSVDFVKALQAAGKPVQFVTLAGEDHWLSRGATRQQMLNSAVAFIQKHNPPG